jgi:hypothetical protein
MDRACLFYLLARRRCVRLDHPAIQGAMMAEYPVEVRRYLTHRAIQRLLEDHGGWDGVALWLYSGSKRPDGSRLPYAFSAEFIAPIMAEDAAAWDATRRKP